MGYNYVPIGTIGFPYEIAKHFKDQDYNILVETGTYYGENALKASRYFQQVYTIEAASEIFLKAKDCCKKNTNITVLHGESDKILEDLIRNLGTKKIVFWLDAHYSGGKTYECSCPLLREIEIINKVCETDAIVIVDDARFVHSTFYGERYADYFDFVNTLSPSKTRYISCVNDMFIATPYSWRPMIDHYCDLLSRKQVELLNKYKPVCNPGTPSRISTLVYKLRTLLNP